MASTVTAKGLGQFTGAFKAAISDFHMVRIEDTENQVMHSSRAWREDDRKTAAALARMRGHTANYPVMDKDLQTLEDAHADLQSTERCLFYKKGFSDGIKFILASIMD